MTNNIAEPSVKIAEDVEDHLKSTYKSAVEQSERALENGKDFALANPVKLALGAFALGVLIAYLLPKPERSRRDRYIQDPLDELKQLLHSVSDKLGHATQETRDNASTAAGGAFKSIKESLGFLKAS